MGRTLAISSIRLLSCNCFVAKEMDMAVSGITMSAERESVVDFTYPFWEEPTAVLVKRTKSTEEIL